MESTILKNILKRKRKNYRCFEIEHFNGKIRTVQSPRTYLKVVQWWILDNILAKYEHDDCIHGFVKGRSYYSNAKVHHGARHLLTLDIKNFFPNIKSNQVASVFEGFGYAAGSAKILTEICTLSERLPQGAPTSPSISNIAFSRIDDELKKVSAEAGFIYSRYADDLTFSGQEYIKKSFYKEVKRIVVTGGFNLNEEKTRFLGVGDKMEVTGLVINDKIQLPRKWRLRARAMFHQASIGPENYTERVRELYGVLNTLKQFEEIEKTNLILAGENAIKKVLSYSKSAQKA